MLPLGINIVITVQRIATTARSYTEQCQPILPVRYTPLLHCNKLTPVGLPVHKPCHMLTGGRAVHSSVEGSGGSSILSPIVSLFGSRPCTNIANSSIPQRDLLQATKAQR